VCSCVRIDDIEDKCFFFNEEKTERKERERRISDIIK